jgi:hypothetical protein
MRLHLPGHRFFLCPEKLYFSSCDSVLLGLRHVHMNVFLKMTDTVTSQNTTLYSRMILYKPFVGVTG